MSITSVLTNEQLKLLSTEQIKMLSENKNEDITKIKNELKRMHTNLDEVNYLFHKGDILLYVLNNIKRYHNDDYDKNGYIHTKKCIDKMIKYFKKNSMIKFYFVIKSINDVSIYSEHELKKVITICDINKLIYNKDLCETLLTSDTVYTTRGPSFQPENHIKIQNMYDALTFITNKVMNTYIIDLALLKVAAFFGNNLDEILNL